MGKNNLRTFDGSKYNVWQVIDLANSYYELSTTFTANLPSTVEGLMAQRFLGVASATNRVLAIELYLKAVLVGQAVPVPMTHDLVVLFNSLPDFIRQDIERMFNARMQATPRQPYWELQYFFGIGDMPESEARKQAEQEVPRSCNTLAGLLERNKEGFVDSRYLFQYAERDKVSVFKYEHHTLAILCSILCEGLESSMQGRNPGYQRRFKFEVGQRIGVMPDYGNRAAYGPMSLHVSSFSISST